MFDVSRLINTPLEELKFSVIDTETTGMNAAHNRIVDIAIVTVQNNKIVSTWETLLDPKQEIPFWITNFTHIRNSHVNGKPSFDDVYEDIYQRIENTIIVGHNVGFDYAFLLHEFARVGKKIAFPKLCTVLLSRTFLGDLPRFGLDTLIDYYNISIENRHRAYPDAYATALIFLDFLAKAKKDFNSKTFYDIQRLQKTKKYKSVNTGKSLFDKEF